MSRAPRFVLVPLAKLHPHEETDEENVAELVSELERTGVFADPIWVARDSWVILNGHHRVEALRRIGATVVPSWVLDYESDQVTLEPWRPGLPITKSEVVRRALSGHRFPPKTTRHHLREELPAHPVPVSKLRRAVRARSYPKGRGTSRRRETGTSESG